MRVNLEDKADGGLGSLIAHVFNRHSRFAAAKSFVCRKCDAFASGRRRDVYQHICEAPVGMAHSTYGCKKGRSLPSQIGAALSGH